MTLHPNWKDILLKAWSLRFLAISMLALGLNTAFPVLSAWWPYSQPLLVGIGFLSGALTAISRVIPQKNLPGLT
jgi:hypothetical protein